ncbi:MAG: hypothetical protein U0L49_01205 [Eubacterium sp.]|nr:hypothetical protein [Eubacterium sp.]
MKEYEMVLEILNECPNNQMRDIFFEEVETDDPEEYIKKRYAEDTMTYTKDVKADGTIIFDIQTSKIHQKASFTEI